MTAYGLTDPLDGLVGQLAGGLVQRVLDLVDERATVVVDDHGVEVRGLVLRRRTTWSHVEAVEVRARVDVLLTEALALLPFTRLVTRTPVVGTLAAPLLDRAVDAVTVRLLGPVRGRLGKVLSVVARPGPDVRLRNQLALLSLVRPTMTDHVLREAVRHGIPVVDERS